MEIKKIPTIDKQNDLASIPWKNNDNCTELMEQEIAANPSVEVNELEYKHLCNSYAQVIKLYSLVNPLLKYLHVPYINQ